MARQASSATPSMASEYGSSACPTIKIQELGFRIRVWGLEYNLPGLCQLDAVNALYSPLQQLDAQVLLGFLGAFRL